MSSPSLSVPAPSRSAGPGQQNWPWWPLLPLYPYGRRRTLVRELIPDQMWSFEQLLGVWYVAVPIRMTALRTAQGLLLYAPVAPTAELLEALRALECRFGPVHAIVLPTASGLEHKLPVPALARAFPQAQVWVTPGQWSYPLQLPLRWLGFPPGRTLVLFEDGLPAAAELEWLPLGPFDLGLGSFMEVACFDRARGVLLVTDALVAIPSGPPAVFDLDPTPLLFHARERGDQPLQDSPAARRRGWQRLVLFANYLRPAPLRIPPLLQVLRRSLAPGCRSPRCHFGLYPFAWQEHWQADFQALVPADMPQIQVAAVLERLVFPRCRPAVVAWIRRLAGLTGVRQLIGAHYEAPVACGPGDLAALADRVETGDWAPDAGNWAALAAIDSTLLRLRLVPREPRSGATAPGEARRDLS
ncbi:MAG: DUF4336 domain-containing protein [Synechococcaceae cyanobacterium]|nr:DUF4336 domain-containing protein [Synechococcaceae cyanobacterium]